jgi:hypothetical protein
LQRPELIAPFKSSPDHIEDDQSTTNSLELQYSTSLYFFPHSIYCKPKK